MLACEGVSLAGACYTGIHEETIVEWTNRAELFRIKGVGEQYSDLLENAGVDTVYRARAGPSQGGVTVRQAGQGAPGEPPGAP